MNNLNSSAMAFNASLSQEQAQPVPQQQRVQYYTIPSGPLFYHNGWSGSAQCGLALGGPNLATYPGHLSGSQPFPVTTPICQDIAGVFDQDGLANAGQDEYDEYQAQKWFEDYVDTSEHDVMDSTPQVQDNLPGTSTAFKQNNVESPSEHLSYTSPGSTYSSWSSGTASSQSQDEIFEEIQRECAEMERQSQSPKNAHKKVRCKPGSHHHRRSGSSASDRKKELNRIAATKYREKKRKEKQDLWAEEQRLEEHNQVLRQNVTDLRSEIAYLQKLVRDMKARSTGSP